jgi:phage shock protein A
VLNEKVLSSGREIVLLKEGIESQKETHEGETRRLTEKLEITENSLQELGLKFRDTEQLCKSLRSVLREKEDRIVDSENVLTQRLQEQNLGASEFQRKSAQFLEDSAEMMARIRELEATAVKTR